MSYDIKIWTVEKPILQDTLPRLNFVSQSGSYVLPLNQGQIIISNPMPVEFEDIPDKIGRELPGILYLVEATLEPEFRHSGST